MQTTPFQWLMFALLMLGIQSCTTALPEPEDAPGHHSTVDVPLVAAYLAETGYYDGNVTGATLPDLQKPLRWFQQDLDLPPSGRPDADTWQKLTRVRLSTAHQEALGISIRMAQSNLELLGYHDFQGRLSDVLTPATQAALRRFQADQGLPATGLLNRATYQRLEETVDKQHTAPVVPPRPSPRLAPKDIDPAMPVFKLAAGDEVFVVENHECKSDYESWVIYYRATVRAQQRDRLEVVLHKRYGLWYDNRREGVSSREWWCIPRQRFCYSPIGFAGWGGAFKPGDRANFKQAYAIPVRFGIQPLIAQQFKQQCQGQPVAGRLPETSDIDISAVKDHIVYLLQNRHFRRPAGLPAFSDADALNTYLHRLDPYSRYLSPTQYRFRQAGQAQTKTGLGINLLTAGDKTLVVPLPHSPAFAAGLQSPHYLLRLNREHVDLSDFAAYRYLGELSPGVKIPLTVVADGKERIYTLTGGGYQKPTLEYQARPDYHLIRVHAFHDNHVLEFKDLLETTLQDNKPLVLDLRFCPGGSLYAAVDMLSLFLEPDLATAYLQKSQADEREALNTLPGRLYDQRPLYLWLSQATASAAEIFTRALTRYSPAATTIGTVTQGKCLAQQVFELSNGGALELSVYEILAADAQPCEGVPLQPVVAITRDITVDAAYDQAMDR